ncbi:TetR/AcrR family transcriptional regulator [Photobacterium kasasachensis]|uniref:TetR/AcrR family transcriptional regulator n=1 Tax=Photobacterium kasasachensis TaxID=2910240 RepID=UPI003D108F32
MNEKKLLLVKTALRLFYSAGVNSVGINEVLKESGVAKKTLYNHFASKEELVMATLQYRDDIFYHWVKSCLDSEVSAKQSVIALFSGLDDWFNDRVTELDEFKGCFFINTAAEFSDPASPVRAYCLQHKEKLRELIRLKVRALTLEPAKEMLLVDTICLLKEGAIVSAFVGGDKEAASKCIPTVSTLIDLEC